MQILRRLTEAQPRERRSDDCEVCDKRSAADETIVEQNSRERILRRAKTRSDDCRTDDNPEELRGQEVTAIVEQNSRKLFHPSGGEIKTLIKLSLALDTDLTKLVSITD